MNEQDDQPVRSRIRVIGEAEQTPVFNCVALVGKRGGQSTYEAQAANLDGVRGQGKSEREALQKLVAEFKGVLADYTARGESIPWRDPPRSADSHECTRFLAVHL